MAPYDEYATQLDAIRNLAPDDSEYWLARDLRPLLGYKRWEDFSETVMRAMEAASNAELPIENHFRPTAKMVTLGSGAKRATEDWFLSRSACYLIAMNADSSKEEVAHAQTYFTIQTRRQEQADQAALVDRRIELRARVKDANKELNEVAHGAGVVRFGIFHDAGYRGLYGGLGKAEIQARKGISAKEDLLDCIGHTELAANYFRITQAQQKIARTGIVTEREAIETHRDVGREVRETMERISRTKPEDLPAEPSLKQLKKAKNKPQSLLD